MVCVIDFNSKSKIDNLKNYHFIFIEDLFDIADELIEKGANMEAKDVKSRTPLLISVQESTIQSRICIYSRMYNVH